MAEQQVAAGAPAPAVPRVTLLRLVRQTVATCFRYRVTGLAAEAGFFALLSLPPLLLGLVGTLGWFSHLIGDETVDTVRDRIVQLASEALSAQSVQQVIVPTLDDVLKGGRYELVSLSFLFSLWSGSRAVNVYVDTITIMYGLSGRRGIVKTRALSFSLYVIGLAIGVVVVPLVLAGPTIVSRILPAPAQPLMLLYWPLTLLLSIAFLTTLYHLSVPVQMPWRRNVPGAVLTMGIWALGSILLRVLLGRSVGGASIFGPLAAPIVILTWLYWLAIAVLIGAAFNAAIDALLPEMGVEAARRTLRDRAARKNPLTLVPPPG